MVPSMHRGWSSVRAVVRQRCLASLLAGALAACKPPVPAAGLEPRTEKPAEKIAETTAAPPAGAAVSPALNDVRYGPWLLDVGTHGITVAWTSRDEHAGRVEHGEGALDHGTVEPKARKEHRVVLDGLLPGRQYRYRILGAQPHEGSFWTAPAEGDASSQPPFRVLIYGDNRTNATAHASVVKAARTEGARLALHTGDMVVDANKEEAWASWFDIEKELLASTAFAATVGNHEITDRGVQYTAHFQPPSLPPYRSFEYGPLHVVVLDSFELVTAGPQPREGNISEAQRAWLEQDLKSVPEGKHVWVLIHQGPFSHPAAHGHGGSDRVRQVLLPFKDKIQAVFAGHDHYYERGKNSGLRYFVVGGGGAPLYEPNPSAPGVQVAIKSLSYAVLEVCGCHVDGVVKDPSGKVLDRFQLSTCQEVCPAQPPQAAATEAGQR